MAIVSDRLDQIAAVLAELGGGDPADIRRALREYDVRDIIAVLANNLAGGNGGTEAGMTRIIQTSVDFTDFPTGAEGETVELFTPQVGTAIVDWWVDPDTFIPWNDTGDESDGYIYQGPAVFDPNTFAGCLGEVCRTGGNPDAPPCAVDEVVNGNRYTIAGLQLTNATVSGACITQSANPVAIYWYRNGIPGDNPPTAGHCDIYFLVADPPLATA